MLFEIPAYVAAFGAEKRLLDWKLLGLRRKSERSNPRPSERGAQPNTTEKPRT
jgi:hypothetical protein